MSTPDPGAWTRALELAAQRTVLVCVGGEIDHLSAPTTTRTLCAAIDTAVGNSGWRVVVDLHEVTFCGTAGLHTLIHTHTHATRHGPTELLFVAPAEHPVTHLLHLTGMSTVLPITTTAPGPLP